jgi:Divergent InlB B-repeat domain
MWRGLLTLAATALLGVAVLAAPRAASAAAWCGTEAGADLPDTVGGNLVHVVYAVPSDAPDRFQERAPLIANDLSLIEDWWRRQDPTRGPRFDFTTVPGCDSRFGQLDITSARTTDPASAYASPDARLPRLLTSLGPTVSDQTKKYLVYFDSPVALNGNICGTAFVDPRRGTTGAVWLAPNLFGFPGCGSLGSGSYYAKTAAHELIHELGALDTVSSPGPPHGCPNDPGHPCDSSSDVLYPGGFGPNLSDYLLDVGHDDYYGHSGPWWDVQDSPWLAHPNAGLRRVSVSVSGAGSSESAVRSSPPGLSCPDLCTQDFDSDMPVALAAEPGEGYEFTGWSGDCTGEGTCSVPLGRAASVTATFAPIRFDVVVHVSGRGRVTSRPRGLVSCPGRCRATLTLGVSARLVPTPARGYRFSRWAGDCTGRKACVVDGDATVTAVFRR